MSEAELEANTPTVDPALPENSGGLEREVKTSGVVDVETTRLAGKTGQCGGDSIPGYRSEDHPSMAAVRQEDEQDQAQRVATSMDASVQA